MFLLSIKGSGGGNSVAVKKMPYIASSFMSKDRIDQV